MDQIQSVQLPHIPKAQWPETAIDEFNARLLGIAEAKAKKNGRIDLSGVQFPGSIDFRFFAECAKPVAFVGAVFRGDVELSNLTFAAPLLFRQAIFARALAARNTSFEDLDCISCQFQLPADFSNARFDGDAKFDGSQFAARANFLMAEFVGEAYFQSASFNRGAMFRGAKFKDKLKDSHAPFPSIARFQGAQFHDVGSFNETAFDCIAVFESCGFHGEMSFLEARFAEAVFFGQTAFDGKALFSEAVFEGPADFSGQSFRGVSFDKAEFRHGVSFANREFREEANFSGVVFKTAPSFHNCKLHQDTDFSRTDFPDTRSDGAARAYRTLKLAMEGARARAEEARFYALEQESLRHRSDTPFSVKVVSWLYEKGSNYGQSYARPMLWLLGAIIGFMAIHGFMIAQYGPENYTVASSWMDGNVIKRLLIFTVEQVVRPFAIWSADYKTLYDEIATALKNAPLLLRLLAGFQSLISLALIALALLALRRRFKMD